MERGREGGREEGREGGTHLNTYILITHVQFSKDAIQYP